jgi:hypothetical protein
LHGSYPGVAVALALGLAAGAVACGGSSTPPNTCPTPSGALPPCDVGIGSQSVGVVLEHPDALVGQTMVVRGALSAGSPDGSFVLVGSGDASERIEVRPRSVCPVDAHNQGVLVRGIFRTHGTGAYMLDSARICVP